MQREKRGGHEHKTNWTNGANRAKKNQNTHTHTHTHTKRNRTKRNETKRTGRCPKNTIHGLGERAAAAARSCRCHSCCADPCTHKTQGICAVRGRQTDRQRQRQRHTNGGRDSARTGKKLCSVLMATKWMAPKSNEYQLCGSDTGTRYTHPTHTHTASTTTRTRTGYEVQQPWAQSELPVAGRTSMNSSRPPTP